MQAEIEAIYRRESRRVLATLIRLIGDFDLAEEALQDAFAVAVQRWPSDGLPANPRAWLVSTGRFKAIDRMRRRARHDVVVGELARQIEVIEDAELQPIEDDRLRLIFTCCHPALPIDAQIALTLREVCGLTTEQIAAAFLSTPSTIAQRIVRAKAKIRETRIPYELPPLSELPARLDGVLHVVYLVFNEGYSTVNREIAEEAIRLGRLIVELLPEAEAIGLLALMLLHESRREARIGDDDNLVLLEEQNRTAWNREYITEGIALVERALKAGRLGPYSVQAAIAAVHAEAKSAAATDWAQIVALYDILRMIERSPVVELNRAAAIAMRDGPSAGIALMEEIQTRGELQDYAPLHTALGELYRRAGDTTAARTAFERALPLITDEVSRRFVERRLSDDH